MESLELQNLEGSINLESIKNHESILNRGSIPNFVTLQKEERRLAKQRQQEEQLLQELEKAHQANKESERGARATMQGIQNQIRREGDAADRARSTIDRSGQLQQRLTVGGGRVGQGCL